MAELGFRTVNEMIGRVDMLRKAQNLSNWKHEEIDLTPILYAPDNFLEQPRFATRETA